MRLPKAIKAIELLGNLASRDYEQDPGKVWHLIDDLQRELKVLRRKFGYEVDRPAASAPIAITAKDPASPAYGGSEWSDVNEAFEALIAGSPAVAKDLLKRALGS